MTQKKGPQRPPKYLPQRFPGPLYFTEQRENPAYRRYMQALHDRCVAMAQQYGIAMDADSGWRELCMRITEEYVPQSSGRQSSDPDEDAGTWFTVNQLISRGMKQHEAFELMANPKCDERNRCQRRNNKSAALSPPRCEKGPWCGMEINGIKAIYHRVERARAAKK